jgi:hypothetical protein
MCSIKEGGEDQMKGFCPSCEKETELSRVCRVDNLVIQEETISVDVDFFTCLQCGGEFDNPDTSYDPLRIAYKEYHRRKGGVDNET